MHSLPKLLKHILDIFQEKNQNQALQLGYSLHSQKTFKHLIKVESI